jgi:hypothetical protein
MYILYLGATGAKGGVNITNPLPGETPEQQIQRYAQNGWLPDAPWQNWFEVTGDGVFYGADFLIPNWEQKTYILDMVLYTKYVEESVLLERSNLLKESDWTQLPDVPEATKLAWQPYRQALRDIPSQPGYPLDVVFPTPPKVNP